MQTRREQDCVQCLRNYQLLHSVRVGRPPDEARRSGDELADATSSDDAGLGLLGELLGLDNAGDGGDLTGSEHLEETL